MNTFVRVIPERNPQFDASAKFNPQGSTIWRAVWPAGEFESNHISYCYELVFFSRGSGNFVTMEQSYACPEHTAFIIPPGLLHSTSATTEVERWGVHFDWYGDCSFPRRWEPYLGDEFNRSLMALPPAPELGLTFPLFRHFSTERAAAFRKLLSEYFSIYPDTLTAALKWRSLLYQLLAFLLESPLTEPDEPVRKMNSYCYHAKNLLDTRFQEPGLQIGDIAETLGISQYHLARIFHQEFQIGPQAYLINRRLLFAEKMLRETCLSVKEIAQHCGFGDAGYFSRLFRKKEGVTPLSFRAGRDANPRE